MYRKYYFGQTKYRIKIHKININTNKPRYCYSGSIIIKKYINSIVIMKRTYLIIIALIIVSTIVTAQQPIFYTDFATTPENINQIVGSVSSILENPTTGKNPDWEIGGHHNNQLAKKKQGHFPDGVTPLSKYGRLSLGGSAGYFLIKQIQGPFNLDVYWGVANLERCLKVKIGNNAPTIQTPEKEASVIKSSFKYDGNDLIDIKISGQRGGLYLYDVLIQK